MNYDRVLRVDQLRLENLKLEIKQTSKAKRLILRVLPEGILRVTAPKRVRRSEIDDLIRINSEWIQKKWMMLSQLPKPVEIQFGHLEKIPFQGQLLTLEIIDGKLTGKVLGDIVDAQRKANELSQLRDKLGLSTTQTIAIGDGANDLKMMAVAGVGVAYHAKPVVQAQATFALNHVGLDGVINLFNT